ncbi:RNA polymerase [Erythrobacter sp. HI00D59]|jgi:RNA polymerase sigma-70 factor (ECF subfamily)|uniref:RNA polymerase sigma factor n=1 Tax=Stakelama marina TaxID=2826939 RepID=A0A8T4IER5_9SPHN|nr:sigma-70 family RNA polymerase sigma factor [Stakelama marina]KZX52477.1 RNA polymerase [Erythrobacter sp. HI00D59]MBR0553498.1 sigma-70 family RNA polymerase sigma factor [Stakelama marina]
MSGAGDNPDEALVSQARAGSKRAFSKLVEHETGRLLALATRMLSSPSQAEDVVQDSLASVWLTRHRLDPDKPIGPYLTTVVLNRCRDRLRRRKVAGFFGLSGDDELHSIADDLPGPETSAVSREELNLVQAEIARMPVRLREALVLVTIEGRSQAEAADLLGTTEKAIETRVYRARNRLKERFEKL